MAFLMDFLRALRLSRPGVLSRPEVCRVPSGLLKKVPTKVCRARSLSRPKSVARTPRKLRPSLFFFRRLRRFRDFSSSSSSRIKIKLKDFFRDVLRFFLGMF